ncbi:MAG: hypothetical protein KBA33_06985 [Cloacibacterium sp.]|nr:hypothetical protein [Cloacibacterium sp.]
MNKYILKTLNYLRKIYTSYNKIDLNNGFNHTFHPELTNQDASNYIKHLLEQNLPCMIARFGGVELAILNNYLDIKKSKPIQYIDYIKGELRHFKWDDKIFEYNYFLFSKKNHSIEHSIKKFSKLFLEDIKMLDVLGSWQEQEKKIKKYYPSNIKTVSLYDLEPYYHTKPWSKALQGKKVLVFHSFEQSIISQYKKRELLFENPDVLPSFDLKVINTFHTFSGIDQDRFDEWFDVLNFMKKQMEAEEFDIAIIGCGPYGFHLAAHAKRIGKKAIHLGGATQVLFGIIGERWLTVQSHLLPIKINEHWVRPSISETPKTGIAEKLDKAAYW